MRANENKLEKVGKVLLEILEGCFYLVKSQPSIVFIWLNLSHLLIVSEVLYQEVIVLWWLQKNFFCLIFKLFALGIFWHGFTVSSYQRPLYWQRINNSYSTISDRILDVIFLIVQRTFLLSYFRGCWLLEFFSFVCSKCVDIKWSDHRVGCGCFHSTITTAWPLVLWRN